MSEQEITVACVFCNGHVLTDDQRDIVESFTDTLAGWLARNADETNRALVRAGLPSHAAADAVLDAVERLTERGWHQHLRQYNA